jgi:hypothetical protein
MSSSEVDFENRSPRRSTKSVLLSNREKTTKSNESITCDHRRGNFICTENNLNRHYARAISVRYMTIPLSAAIGSGVSEYDTGLPEPHSRAAQTVHRYRVITISPLLLHSDRVAPFPLSKHFSNRYAVLTFTRASNRLRLRVANS